MRLLLLLVASVAALTAAPPANEKFYYTIEWRLIEAGRATVTSTPRQLDVKVESAGLVSRLYKVDDDYRVNLSRNHCAASILLQANEGKRRRETRVAFDAQRRLASYHEQDLVKNATVLQKEIETPVCVNDVIGALFALRSQNIPLGHFIDMPVSDGKKYVSAKIEAQEREQVKTPVGTFRTVRYEAYLFDNVLYTRKARLFVWLTDDDRRLPVQIRLRFGMAVGTINLQMTKEEHQ